MLRPFNSAPLHPPSLQFLSPKKTFPFSPSSAQKFVSINRMLEPMEEEQTASNPKPKPLDIEFPKPLSHPPPQHSREIEYNRAMLAEAAVKAGPALTQNEIIYEDEWMIGVNKPAGVYCEHILSSIPDLLHSTGTENDASSLELHLANRLDRDTSGVMVVTKLHKIAGKLMKAFTERKVRKAYLALCIGPAPKWSEISIESGHGRSKFGAWRVYSRDDVGRILPGGSVVREMTTRLEVLSVNGNPKVQHGISETPQNSIVQREPSYITYESDSSRGNVEKLVVSEKNIENIGQVYDDFNALDINKNDEVLIRAYPKSGRTHQIRLHCQYLGLSIRGDVKYEGPHTWKGITYANHALHAESLSFEHPVTHSMVKMHASIPQWAIEAYGYSQS